MDKFWKWIDKKYGGLIEHNVTEKYIIHDSKKMKYTLSKTAIIGDMIEYLMEKNKKFINQSYYLPRCATFNDVYSYLKLRIEEINE